MNLRKPIARTLLAAIALASSIPITASAYLAGTSWSEGIFWQQYWHRGRCFWSLSNTTNSDRDLVLHGVNGERQRVPLARGAHEDVPIEIRMPPSATGLVTLELGQELDYYEPPLEREHPADPGYLSDHNLNQEREGSLHAWMSQRTLRFRSGESIDVIWYVKPLRTTVPPRPRILSFAGASSPYARSVLEGAPLPLAPVESVQSPGVTVRRSDAGDLELELKTGPLSAGWQRITARFRAPVVREPTRVLLLATLLQPPIQPEDLSRGVLVVP